MAQIDLIAVAQRIARRAFVLYENPNAGPCAGFWCGRDISLHGELAVHFLTINAPGVLSSIAPAIPSLSLYTNGIDAKLHMPPATELAALSQSAPKVYALPHLSMPPPWGLEFVLGNKRPNERAPASSRILDTPVTHPDIVDALQRYEQFFFEHDPLYHHAHSELGDAIAMVGGWHHAWPDEDWETRLEDQLVITTLARAEPWIEVFRTRAGDWEVCTRIT
ncbi:MAG: hypothetical protein KBG84_10075 [Planctomycetes bacterium]|jgi:hypothetical protein|nr:hypothetical protein [Planctomycetota bacterium]